MVESEVSVIRDLPVILPDGRLLGTVHDTVVETDSWTCTHIFVADPPADLVEGRIHVAVPSVSYTHLTLPTNREV